MPDKSGRCGDPVQAGASAETMEALARLDGILRRALTALGLAGESESACRMAAEAWSVLRRHQPDEAERYTALLHRLTSARYGKKETHAMTKLNELDVRSLPPADRHHLIFDKCDHLAQGAAFVLVNDHDPKPLYYQLEAERHGQFSWDYLEQGPRVWRVKIGRRAAA